MHDDHNAAALRNAPLDSRTAPRNGCDLAAPECMHGATNVQRLSDLVVVLNGGANEAERAGVVNVVIGGWR